MLASLLLLGGCIRFGPQAEEMENTASQSAKSSQAEKNGQSSPAESSSDSSSAAADSEQGEDLQAGGKNSESAADGSDSKEENAADSGEKSSKESADSDKRQIEAAASQYDSQSIVTIDLQRLPQGYSLFGLSWTPAASVSSTPMDGSSLTGQAPQRPEGADQATEQQKAVGEPSVTTTYHDAILAGQAGSDGFFIDQDGQRIGYRYTEQQRGTSGTMRLEFRDSDGGVVSWEQNVTLGTANPTADEGEE